MTINLSRIDPCGGDLGTDAADVRTLDHIPIGRPFFESPDRPYDLTRRTAAISSSGW